LKLEVAMAFCSNCGAQVQGSFCAACGAAVGAASSGQQTSGGTLAKSGDLPDHAAAALCYILGVITGILFLTLEPYSRKSHIRFHAWQAIFLHVAAIAAWFLFSVVAYAIPFIGWTLLWLAYPLSLAFVVVWLIVMYKAYTGESWVLPVIGPIAQSKAA
jgi:uncharacterized membrane protein